MESKRRVKMVSLTASEKKIRTAITSLQRLNIVPGRPYDAMTIEGPFPIEGRSLPEIGEVVILTWDRSPAEQERGFLPITVRLALRKVHPENLTDDAWLIDELEMHEAVAGFCKASLKLEGDTCTSYLLTCLANGGTLYQSAINAFHDPNTPAY